MKNSQRPGSLNESKLSNHSLRHKEKRRTESLNKAFCELRKCIPHVPCDTKLSKIKTLQLASSYIAYLSSLLEDPRTEETNREFNISFNPCLSSKRRKNNSVRDLSYVLFALSLEQFYFLIFLNMDPLKFF